ncbi:tRNA G10 N-methylase Trm11 [Spirosomataceae bacterium TFI 002]|nr:tRNA G10 N-methylase Trm11 [Spirosomataceae bacterium TFI 002]
MTPQTATTSYIYSYKYDFHHSDLCKLESRQVFEKEENDKLLFSNIEVEPSISPFIKTRFEIISTSNDYSELIESVKSQRIEIEGFKAEYLILNGDETAYDERRKKLNDIGHCIEGEPNYENPTITYAICTYQGLWYFGVLVKHNSDWQKHKQKPCSFSNSISMNIAKTLVSIAAKGDKSTQLLDACCGVGTIMLEACISGFKIEGCDLNWKACKNTRENLAFYEYEANVYRSDIKDIDKKYDASIIDLPYNLTTYSDDTITTNIIESVAKLTNRIVIVSITDIEPIIQKCGLKVTDFCRVEKRGKSKFTRSIWVCEK